MRLAGESQRHVGAAVEGVFKGNHGRAFGVGAGDLDRVFDGLRAGADQHGFLHAGPRHDCVEPLGQPHVAPVGQHVKAGVQETVELLPDRLDHRRRTMPGVEAANAAGEIDHAVAVDVFNDSALGAIDEDGSYVESALGDCGIAALHQLLRAWAGDWGAELYAGHLSTIR